MTFIAGHYDAYWKFADTPTIPTNFIGTTRDGLRLQQTHHMEVINTDDFGDAPVNGVQRGTESRLTLDFVEYDLIEAALYAQQEGAGGGIGASGLNVGFLLHTLSGGLELVAKAGTPAEQKPAIKTLTASHAIIISDFELIMASRLRQGPCTFMLLPYHASSPDYTLDSIPSGLCFETT